MSIQRTQKRPGLRAGVLGSLLLLLLLALPDLLAGQTTNLRLPSLPWGTPEEVVRERLEARGFHFAGEPEDGTLLFDRGDLLGHRAGIIARTFRGQLVKVVVLMEPESPAAPEREFGKLRETLAPLYGTPAPSPAGATPPQALWLERDRLGRPYGARLTIDPEDRLRLDLESALWPRAANARSAGAGHRTLVRSFDPVHRWAALEFTTRMLGGTRAPLRIRARVTNVSTHRTTGLRVPVCLPWVRIYREGRLVYDRGEVDACGGPERLVDLTSRESETHELSVPVGEFLPADRHEVTLEVFVYLPPADHPGVPPRAAREIRVGEVVVSRTSHSASK